MTMRKILPITVSAMLLAAMLSCTSRHYRTDDRGVTVVLSPMDPSLPNLVRIRVINEDIFRVTATPERDFADRESLSVIGGESRDTDFTVSEQQGEVVVSTGKVSARVSLSDGTVSFLDAEGNPILREETGGRSFEPISVDGHTGYSFRQVFESPDEEAFFGLGQHQSDEWNYKGKNEVLYQYNTKVSVPMVVSNKNYGILWDNYSLTRFGHPGEYREMSQFRLYDARGEEGGLTATYTTADGEVFLERQEEKIDYENLSAIGNFPEGFPFYGSTITWEGAMEPAGSGEYEFKLYYAGYTTVMVDGE